MCKLKDFYDISIKGRYAYAMCCVENAILHYGFDVKQWKDVVRKLWTFPAYEEYANGWPPLVSGCFPHDFPEIVNFFEEDEKSKNGLQRLLECQELFLTQSNETINNMIENTYSIMFDDLLEDIYYPGNNSLRYLLDIICSMQENDIVLPDVEPFKQYVFDPYNIGDENANNGEFVANLDDEGRKQLLCHAYGIPFDGTQYSKILNNPA